MNLVMCRDCGSFVPADEDGSLHPTDGKCPDCGGTEFKDVDAENADSINTD